MNKGKKSLSRKDKFLQALTEYFNATPPVKVVDTNYIDEERKWIIDHFSDVKWQEINADTLLSNSQSLFFLSPTAYCYFLPAFMRASILLPKANEITSAILTSLSFPKKNSEQKDFIKVMSRFNENQKATILLFLEILKDEEKEDLPAYELNKIINKYWHQFKKF